MKSIIVPYTEKQMQSALYRWALYEKNHELAITNKFLFGGEADFLSMTRSRYTHEFEIKRSKSDYRADFKNKVWKHDSLSRREPFTSWNKTHPGIANYFWFATWEGLEIDPPEYAGWAKIKQGDPGYLYVDVVKKAPLLHRVKFTPEQVLSIAGKLSYRMATVHIDNN